MPYFVTALFPILIILGVIIFLIPWVIITLAALKYLRSK